MSTKIKGFTLIELLVVVAIIGILAAVGVVAYSGYTSATKASTTKSNHATAVKYVSNEIMKCEIGVEAIFLDAGTSKIYCTKVGDGSRYNSAFLNDKNLLFLNPMKNKNSFAAYSVMIDPFGGGTISDNYGSDTSVGHIFFQQNKWPIILRSCFQTPCSNTNNVLTASFNYQ